MKLRILFLIATAVLFSTPNALAQKAERSARVAVLDFGNSAFGRQAADDLYAALSSEKKLSLLDREQSRTAARGAGYTGSLNMTLAEARDLGAAIGCDFYITGNAETLRRSASDRPIYYESFAAVFLVSARSGSLLRWERPAVEASTPEGAGKPLRANLSKLTAWVIEGVLQAMQNERDERARALEVIVPVIEEVPDEDSSAATGLQTPRPYRRLRPAYPESAARAEAEATVDALVDIDEKGEVGQVRIVRWGGFGLDEATKDTVQHLHFFPAMRNGQPVPLRVLLRYNFRKPPPDPKK
ncbi:MAG TPA: energy transducer TonB [Pyrinomonadaceae bacterium]